MYKSDLLKLDPKPRVFKTVEVHILWKRVNIMLDITSPDNEINYCFRHKGHIPQITNITPLITNVTTSVG